MWKGPGFLWAEDLLFTVRDFLARAKHSDSL
jgi:hypothetical protein